MLFVETHRTDTPSAFTRTRIALNHPEVTILEIHLPAFRWADGAFIDAERLRILQERLSGEFEDRFSDAVLWFNDPMAVTAYAGNLGEQMIVYDCMDELSQFHGAPSGLVMREQELTRRADVVFCGGRKMRARRLALNPNTHFYGTGVDCEHFGTVLSSKLKVDPEIAALRGPVLGYFGVVDERIDYDLLTALADASPDWSVAIVGPTAKVAHSSLPKRPNLHFFGPRPYLNLPAITKGFSVCIMPFALNASTEFINPTKALEYMAAGRPVVSTALDEVQTNFRSVPCIGRTHEEFIVECRRAATAPCLTRVKRGLKLAAENTWEAIMGKMEWHINGVLDSQSKLHIAGAAKRAPSAMRHIESAYV